MYKTKNRTKKRSKICKTCRKRSALRRRKSVGGTETGFVKGLRGKTKTMRRINPMSEREKRRTVNPNGINRFNRSGRTYAVDSLTFLPKDGIISTPPRVTRENLKSPTIEVSELMTDNQYGPSKQGLYAGPSIKYGSQPAIPHGKEGTIMYPTGDVYVGDFVKGRREGTGKLIIKQGPTYEGEWKDDKFSEFVEWKAQNKVKK